MCSWVLVRQSPEENLGHNNTKQVQSPEPEEEQAQAPVYAEQVKSSFAKKEPGGSEGQQIEHEPTMCSFCEEAEWCLH